MTIDIGFAWTELPSGASVAIVDVLGHERIISNTLADLGPGPAVMLVVSLQEGWQAQTTEHLAAIDALGICTGVIVATFADSVGPKEIPAKIADIRAHVCDTTLAQVPIVAVSTKTGEGIVVLRTVLDSELSTTLRSGADAAHDRLRLWIERSFVIKGAGTIITGTLSHGSVHAGDALELITVEGKRYDVSVRGLQAHNCDCEQIEPYVRAAVNLRGVSADEISRGAALVEKNSSWWQPHTIDVVAVRSGACDSLPSELLAHIGSLSTTVRVRPLDDNFARVQFLQGAPPLRVNDRLVLCGPGVDRPVGCDVVDLDPPSFSRRGDAARRAAELKAIDPANPRAYIERKQAILIADLQSAGFFVDTPPEGVVAFRSWWVASSAIVS